METKVQAEITAALSHKNAGEIVFPTDFRGIGTEAAIKKSLSRLAKAGNIRRLAHGIYYVPKRDQILGDMRPDVDEVVKMLAKKEHIRVRPAGAFALHTLGLTTQIPTKRVYITDGSSRRIKLGRLEVRFKATSPKKMSAIGEISGLVIQAIEEIGTQNVKDDVQKKLYHLLLKEDPSKLKHDLSVASAKVHDFIIKLLKQSPVT